MSDHPGDEKLGERIGKAWRAEEQPLPAAEQVAFNDAVYARIEARKHRRRWGVALAVPVAAACAVLAIAVVPSPDGPAPEASELWTHLTDAQATWEATFSDDDDVTDATVQWLARPNPETELAELLSSDYQLMAAWLEPTPTTTSATSAIQEK